MKLYLKQKLGILLTVVIVGSFVFTACNDEEPLSDLTGFTSFEMLNDTIKDYPFIIDNGSMVIENADSLPYQYNPVNLVAQFSAIEGSTVAIAGVSQVSGITANDFNEPVKYVVTAEDGVTTKQYTVRVNVAQTNPEGLKWNLKNPNALDASFETQEYFYLNGKHWVILGKKYMPGVSTASSKLYSSENGETWVEETPTGDFPVGFFHNIIETDGKAYVMGYASTVQNFGTEMLGLGKDIFYTEDGISWNKIETTIDEVRILTPLFNFDNNIVAFEGNKVLFGNFEQAKHSGAIFNSRLANATSLIFDGANFAVSVPHTFNPAGDVPKMRTLASGYVYNDKMYVLGGLDMMGFPLSEVLSSTDGVVWTEVSKDAFSPRIKAGTVVYDDKVWLIGGQLADGTCTNEILVSEDGGITWTEIAEDQVLPENFTPRCNADIRVDEDGNICIIGGESTTVSTDFESNVMIEYTTLTDVWFGKLNKLN